MEYREIYKFCPRCKSALEFKENKFFSCSSCGYYYYINAIPCNAVILENDNADILLVKRKFDPQKGYWDLPGGFLDIKETAEDSVKREIKEELGIEIVNITYFASFPDRYLFKDINHYTLGLVYTAKISEGELKANDDVETIEFFKKNEIPFEKIAFSSVATALKQYVEKQ